MAIGVLVGGLTGVISAIREINKISEPADVFERTRSGVADSQWGWLVDEVVIVPIDEPRVGAFVVNNPANGVIHIDDRRWGLGALDELMAHEIGHLLDFAIYKDHPPFDPNRRGGLEQEVWAECAAVDAGLRKTDPERDRERYRCRASELKVFRAELAAIDEICRPWGVPECRPIDYASEPD